MPKAYAIAHVTLINSEKFIGGGTLILFFIVIPLFLYYRWKNKKLKDFILDNKELEKMKN